MTSDERPAGWQRVTLGAVCSEVRYGYTASARTEPVGPRFLRITDIVGGSVEWSAVPFCEATEGSRLKYELLPGDIVIARTGASAGVSHYCQPTEPAVFASYLVRFRVDRSRASARYVAYVLQSPSWWAYVGGASAGSAQPQLNAQSMRSFTFLLPSLREQEHISSVLAALDGKIESNRRLVSRLEETAEAVFQARFVDFVGVKTAHQNRRVPVGWSVAPIGDVLSVVGGGTPSTKEPRFWNGRHCWATPKDLAGAKSPILLDTERHVTDEGLAQISSKLLPKRTVLLSSRAPVGYTAVTYVDLAVNQGFIAIPPSDKLPSEFVLLWLRKHIDEIKAHAGGTTFAEISKRAFRPLRILVPPPETLRAFLAMARPSFDQIATLERESHTLLQLRDALLAKLISGQIGLADAADLADEVELACVARP